MNKSTILSAVSVAAVSVWSLILISGCESSDGNTIKVTPEYAEVSAVKQAVVLTASGWSDYSWTLENENIGYLSPAHGATVTYVATEITATDVTQTVIVSAKGALIAGGTNTTGSSSAYIGNAAIRHIGTGTTTTK